MIVMGERERDKCQDQDYLTLEIELLGAQIAKNFAAYGGREAPQASEAKTLNAPPLPTPDPELSPVCAVTTRT